MMRMEINNCIQEQEQRISYVEKKINTLNVAHNTMVDSYQEHSEEIPWLKQKIADLEDRSRRNNIKFRGVPESVSPQELGPYLLRFLKVLVPSVSDTELLIDRSHCIPKLPFLKGEVPRDVLAHIHFYRAKEEVLNAAKHLPTLPEPFVHIKLFSDLSATTMQTRKTLARITSTLRDHKIPYK